MALLKDLIVTGASKFIGDTYLNTVKSGDWEGTIISKAKGGTGVDNTNITARYVFAAPTAAGAASFRALTGADVALGNVVNTGDSATPVSGGTTKFTTGGAYTEISKINTSIGSLMTTVQNNSYVTATSLNDLDAKITANTDYINDVNMTVNDIDTALDNILGNPSVSKVSTVTSISNVPITAELVEATISASGSFTLASIPQGGISIHIIVKNTSTSLVTITLPTSSPYINLSDDTLPISASKYGEINCISDGTNIFIRTA